MDVTVAICTWNRAALLDLTLSRMCALRIPDDVEWELIIVNNNCSDGTDAVLDQYSSRLPVRRIFEPRQGHSHARNAAIDAATGEFLLWTDDDVLVDREWLAEYVSAARQHPHGAFFGGTVNPWLEREPPKWFRRHWDAVKESLFVVRQLGDFVGPIPQDVSPAGANMGFRTEVQRQFRYDTLLGRVASTLSGGDDTAMVERMRSAGLQGIWVGTAQVDHFVPASRLTRSFMKRWFHGAGRTYVRQEWPLAGQHVAGVPVWLCKRLAKNLISTWMYEPMRNDRWYKSFREAAIAQGAIAECYARYCNESKSQSAA